jgi:hypothetical protein
VTYVRVYTHIYVTNMKMSSPRSLSSDEFYMQLEREVFQQNCISSSGGGAPHAKKQETMPPSGKKYLHCGVCLQDETPPTAVAEVCTTTNPIPYAKVETIEYRCFHPCGHVVCDNCVKKLEKRQCPYCRESYIISTILHL